MEGSPLDAHVASPREIADRIAAERSGTPFLLYRSAGGGGQVIRELGPGVESLTIGRRAGNQVVLDDDRVSRVHAELARLGDDWVIADDGLSHNGTFVNGERVTTRRRLRDGDRVLVGGTTLVFLEPSRGSVSAPTLTGARPVLRADVTPAQRRVLVALCRPFRDAPHALPASNQVIADELVVSVETVKSTLRGLYEAFGLEALPQNAKRQALALGVLRSGVVSRQEL